MTASTFLDQWLDEAEDYGRSMGHQLGYDEGYRAGVADGIALALGNVRELHAEYTDAVPAPATVALTV